MEKSFAVIGLGSFGRSVANELIDLSADLLVIDHDEHKVNQISKRAQNAVICDATDEDALRQLGIQNIDHVIVCIGDDQASILTSLILKEMEVDHVTVKVNNDYHAKVVKAIGVQEIIHPEKDMGKRFANRVIKDSILEYFRLTDEYSYVEIEAPESFFGKTIVQMDVRKKYNVNVVSVKRNGNIITPSDADPFQVGDILLIVGNNKDIAKFK